ncbi:MAG: DUF2442 domain-containing protein [Lamprocystis purpurea]|jgi:hypothetical protein|uniref:DUF2442 domain-containing protein n=1 Tax=Lamprocystis purpurea TaxID=61598 RepID=UPI0009FC966A|nr:DUF2442 domain-containing protein [Lamprocystis purpurea]MBV5275173.1 DUF2442 domain-containing protein [Lamprocystis purpurea]
MHPSAKHVSPLADYVLFIEFDNDESGHLDMKPFLDFGVFNRIRDPEIFNQVRVSFDSVEWPSGIDLDPEFIYTKCNKTPHPAIAYAPTKSCARSSVVDSRPVSWGEERTPTFASSDRVAE